VKKLNQDERLAAFLDGRLDEREREAMLAHLTADADAYEVFAHTTEVLRLAEADVPVPIPAAVEPGGAGLPGDEGGVVTLPLAAAADAGGAPGPDADPGVIRLHPRKPAAVRWLALAAGIVGLALAGRALWPRESFAGDPVRLAAHLEQADRGLPARWTEDTPWASVRGDGATGGTSTKEQVARAADAGALLLDLSVAVQGRDSAETWLLATQIAELYDPRTTGPGGALQEIADGAGSPAGPLHPLVEQATDRIAQRLGQPDALRLGAWVEAARLAAKTRDAAFFEAARTQRILDDAARLTASDPRARGAVEQVRGLVPGAGPPRWEALTHALDLLVGVIVSD
jgi:hypothetical protein